MEVPPRPAGPRPPSRLSKALALPLPARLGWEGACVGVVEVGWRRRLAVGRVHTRALLAVATACTHAFTADRHNLRAAGPGKAAPARPAEAPPVAGRLPAPPRPVRLPLEPEAAAVLQERQGKHDVSAINPGAGVCGHEGSNGSATRAAQRGGSGGMERTAAPPATESCPAWSGCPGHPGQRRRVQWEGRGGWRCCRCWEVPTIGVLPQRHLQRWLARECRMVQTSSCRPGCASGTAAQPRRASRPDRRRRASLARPS